MIIKVCGMRESQNICDLTALNPSMIGFIFYDKSPRYVASELLSTPPSILRVGVFVNSTLEFILSKVKSCSLDCVQLHGSESIELCRELRAKNLKLIKAISIADIADIEFCREYDGEVDYILLDTKCSGFGGSGERFDWSILESYSCQTPFLLSGGIDSNMATEINNIKHPKFAGVDLNSRFEKEPALKDINKLSKFITTLKKQNNE